MNPTLAPTRGRCYDTHQLVVAGVRRDPPDWDRFIMSLISMAMDEVEAEERQREVPAGRIQQLPGPAPTGSGTQQQRPLIKQAGVRE